MKDHICKLYGLKVAHLFDSSLVVVWSNFLASLSNKINTTHSIASSTLSWILYLHV